MRSDRAVSTTNPATPDPSANRKEKHSPFQQRGLRRWRSFGSFLIVCLVVSGAAWAASLTQQLGLHSGGDIYQAACVACHGDNGNGTPQAIAGFERPDTFPHFARCEETTPESTRDYTAVVRDGGPARGFSQIMPSFGAVLTSEEINKVVAYLRSFCKDRSWPLGELNVPRALVTDKAFPESETTLTTTASAKGAASVTNEVDYERILGKHDQLEVVVPFGWAHQPGDGLAGGLGDITFGEKHVLFSRLNSVDGEPLYDSTGSILSLQGEITVPTGSVSRGLGTGQTTFGLFAAYDVLLPAQVFVQTQAGTQLPVHAGNNAPRSVYFYTAFGKTLNADRQLGRLWSPMIELLGNRDLVSGAVTDWDVLPEFQVTLSRRQHIRAALGYRVPLNDTANRPKQIIAYFLWDWADGGFLEGW
jgi:mono/diheme cytochrome c family protein